jgi:hypothetical protein
LVLLVLVAVAMTSGGMISGGTPALAAAPDTGTGVRPITIGTVPPVPNFPVTLDAVTEFTDTAGNAHFDGHAGGLLADRITLTEATLPFGAQQIKAQATRFYQGAGMSRLALSLSYLVTFHFSQGDGSPIDTSSVQSITVKSETGEIAELPAHGSSWLLGIRILPRGAALIPRTIGWRVQSVQYAGTNVVNTSQQRFVPADRPEVDVQLLFYGLDVRAHDAVFGFRSGGAVDLAYPDGTSRRFSLDDSGRLRVPALPRGDYTLTTSGSGPRMSRPLAISQTQVVDLAVYSWLDILTILTGALALTGGLAFVGRARRRRAPRHAATHRHRTATSMTLDDPAGTRDTTAAVPAEATPTDEDGRGTPPPRESLESEVVPPRGA